MSKVIGYISLGSIKGMASDEKHKEWIELTGVDHQIHRNINPTSKPLEALTTSQVQLGAIGIQKKADCSSPEIVAAVCKGQTFDEVTIDLVRTTDAGHDVYYQWKLTDAYISSYGVLSNSGGGVIETLENISLCFSKVKWSYKKTDSKGKPQGSVDAGWDLAANKTA